MSDFKRLGFPQGEIDAASRAVMEGLASHPLVQGMIRRQEGAKRNGAEMAPRNTEPWHALAEKYTAAIMCFASLPKDQREIGWAAGDDVGEDIQPGLVGAKIATATTYLWRDAMVEVARSAPLPSHVIAPDVLPTSAMFWSWESGYSLDETDGGMGGTNDWLAVLADAEGINMVWNVTNTNNPDYPPVILSVSRVGYGQTWPKDFPEAEMGPRYMAELLLKYCAFLNSSFVDAEPTRMERARRRDVARSVTHKDQADELISVVQLRRKDTEETSKNGTPTDVEWKHQWWVGGHYRAQWYPSLEAHKVIWIAPHMKGPRDKPLLERVYSVER